MDLSMKTPHYTHKRFNQRSAEFPVPLDYIKTEPNGEETIYIKVEDNLSMEGNQCEFNGDNIFRPYALPDNTSATAKRTYAQMQSESNSENETEEEQQPLEYIQNYNDLQQQQQQEQYWSTTTPYPYTERSSTPLLTTHDNFVPLPLTSPTTVYPYTENDSTTFVASNDLMASSALSPTTAYHYNDDGFSTAFVPTNELNPLPLLTPSPAYITSYYTSDNSSTAFVPNSDFNPSTSLALPSPAYTTTTTTPYYGNTYSPYNYNPMLPMAYEQPNNSNDMYTYVLQQQLKAIYLGELVKRQYLLNYYNPYQQ